MIELLTDILKSIVPPPDAEHARQYAWRLAIALLLGVTFLGLCGITAFAFGMLPNTQGFARASEVQQLSKDLQQDRAERIEGELLQLRILHCSATTDVAKQLYWQRIATLMVRYQQITGRVYSLPACADL